MLSISSNGSMPGTGIIWAQHPTTDGSVINAHSLYFETLAETGVVGIVLIVGLLLVFLWAALRRAFSEIVLPATRTVRKTPRNPSAKKARRGRMPKAMPL